MHCFIIVHVKTIQELNIRCKQECIPIVYDARYNIDTTRPQLVLPPQSIQLDKPFQVFSKIKGQSYLSSQTIHLNHILLTGEHYKTVKSADIATVYEISYYVSAPLRQVIPIACLWHSDIDTYIQFDVKKLIELMKLDIPETTTWKSFSSVVLRPLRYQMMGSVLVRISNY